MLHEMGVVKLIVGATTAKCYILGTYVILYSATTQSDLESEHKDL